MKYRSIWLLSLTAVCYVSAKNAAAYNPEGEVKTTRAASPSQLLTDRQTSAHTEHPTSLPGLTDDDSQTAPEPIIRNRTTIHNDIRKKLMAAKEQQTLDQLLLAAAAQGYDDLVRTALGAGADINTHADDGVTPLHVAVLEIPSSAHMVLSNRYSQEGSLAGYYSTIEALLECEPRLDLVGRVLAEGGMIEQTVAQTIIAQQQIEILYLFAQYGAIHDHRLQSQSGHRGLSPHISYSQTVDASMGDEFLKAIQLGQQAYVADGTNSIVRPTIINEALTYSDGTSILIPPLIRLIDDYAGPYRSTFIPKQVIDAIQIQKNQSGCTSCTVS